MIYLNHAATSYPKPQCVLDAYTAALAAPPAGQFRSSGSDQTNDIFTRCRSALGHLLGIADSERIFFSSGATDSLNQILSGLQIPAAQIITTATEHNSVLRPLYNLPGVAAAPDASGRAGAGPVIIPCDRFGSVSPAQIEAAITPAIRAIILNHCSNVTGCIQDAAAVGDIAARHGLYFILDCSQSAGVIPIQADDWNVAALAFTGHKGLHGIQGTGGFYLRKNLPCYPVRFGGTGRDSSKLVYQRGEEEYEVGTQNACGIAALYAGVNDILSCGVDVIEAKELLMMQTLYEALQQLPGIRLYGDIRHNRGPVLSFNIKGMKPSDVSYILQNGYDIVTRTGLHCAPLIHKYIGSGPEGTVRVSISDKTTSAEMNAFLNAISEITACQSI